MTRPEEIEHVNTYFYARPGDFGIQNFRCDLDVAGLTMAVDVEEDMSVLSAVIAAMDKPHWEYGLAELVRLYRSASATS